MTSVLKNPILSNKEKMEKIQAIIDAEGKCGMFWCTSCPLLRSCLNGFKETYTAPLTWNNASQGYSGLAVLERQRADAAREVMFHILEAEMLSGE